MGEYAEMMLDGTCCSCCGEYLGGDEGFPVMCPGCSDYRDNERKAAKPKKRRTKAQKPAKSSGRL